MEGKEKMMLLVVADHISPRLRFICDFIFKEQFGLSYILQPQLFSNEESFFTINYSAKRKDTSDFYIRPFGLLEESGIKNQQVNCCTINEFKAFFTVEDSDLRFDIFSASFYLLSRYEEYLPHTKDMYGRYAHENSLAFTEDFLHIPLINYWLHYFKQILQTKFPALVFKQQQFTFIPTYDIDIAYSYKGKGLVRNIGGFLQSPGVERIAVNIGAQQDPYDAYEFMHQLHNKYSLHPVYFFLLAEKTGKYDKNLSPAGKRMSKLLRDHTDKYATGIHPSWESFLQPELIDAEKKLLEKFCNTPVTQSRQHYIKFELPETFRLLLSAGINDEYSMGYGSINGFRASVASSFYWYDLQEETATSLRLHPFCFMDANSFFEEKLTPEQSLEQLIHFYDECKKVNGLFITIFHNNFLGTDKMFAGFREMYQQFLSDHFFVEFSPRSNV